jgi:ribosomal protein S18 acetylase RimI-like enzyme
MRIREVCAGDATAAAALWTEAYTRQHPSEGRRQPYAEGELALARAEATVLVAESEPGQLLGIAGLVPAASPRGATARPGEAELSRLAVTAAARGRGVGRALVVRCLGLAREQGAAAVALWSRPYQVEAHSLYESLGFRRNRERDETDADGARWVFTLGLGTKR